MKNDGGSAFPSKYTVWVGADDAGFEKEYREVSGMSLRDYFAGQAISEAMRLADSVRGLAVMPDPRENATRIAYEVADAMLKAREE